MKLEARIYNFFNNIMPSYPAGEVPDDAQMPYLTYTLPLGDISDTLVVMDLDIYARTDSEAEINDLARHVGEVIGYGGTMLACDEGGLWLKRGSPFSIPAPSGDLDVKRRRLQLFIDYFLA